MFPLSALDSAFTAPELILDNGEPQEKEKVSERFQ